MTIPVSINRPQELGGRGWGGSPLQPRGKTQKSQAGVMEGHRTQDSTLDAVWLQPNCRSPIHALSML